MNPFEFQCYTVCFNSFLVLERTGATGDDQEGRWQKKEKKFLHHGLSSTRAPLLLPNTQNPEQLISPDRHTTPIVPNLRVMISKPSKF
jgi:hypothetical protein